MALPPPQKVDSIIKPNTIINNSSVFDCLCSSITTVLKSLIADTTLAEGTMFSEFTVKVRSMGTNTYIGIGATSQNFRFTGASQSYTFAAPQVNGNVAPLNIHTIRVIGDGANGVLEVSGIMVYIMQEKDKR